MPRASIDADILILHINPEYRHHRYVISGQHGRGRTYEGVSDWKVEEKRNESHDSGFFVVHSWTPEKETRDSNIYNGAFATHFIWAKGSLIIVPGFVTQTDDLVSCQARMFGIDYMWRKHGIFARGAHTSFGTIERGDYP